MKKVLLALACMLVLSSSALAEEACQVKNVWIIWRDGCVFCNEEESFLNTHNIAFERIQEGSQRAADIPHWGTPATLIKGLYGGKDETHFIDGYNEDKLRQFLCIPN